MAAQYIDKIFHVTGDMEADKITQQKASDNILTPRDDIKDVRCRKRRMMKKANFQIRAERFKIGGNHPQIILVYPHECILVGLFCDTFGKDPIDLQIVLPVVVVKFGLIDKRENRWPKSFFGKHAIELINVLFR